MEPYDTIISIITLIMAIILLIVGLGLIILGIHDFIRPFIIRRRKIRELNQLMVIIKNYTNLSDVCAICLNNFVIPNKVAELNCRHLYHYQCILKWLVERRSCPLCISVV